MITLRATAAGPWGQVGSEFHVKEIGKYRHYVDNGTLVEVDTYAGMSSKERAIARAEALGLPTKGTEKEINARIEEHEQAALDATDVPSQPGTGVVGPVT